MRAVAYLGINLALLYIVNRFGLWRQMFGDAIIFAWWAWIIFGAIWVGNAQLRGRRAPPVSQAEADAFARAARKASEHADTSQGRGPV